VVVVTGAAVVLSRRELRRARGMTTFDVPAYTRGEGGPGWVSSPHSGLEPALTRAREPEPPTSTAVQGPSNSAPLEPPTPHTAATAADLAKPESVVESRPGQLAPSGETLEAALLELLDDDRISVRLNAVTALSLGRGAHALRGLSYAISRDPSVEVRREAIQGLRSLAGKRDSSVGSPQAQEAGTPAAT
jgi:hypothetical protein